MENLGPTIQKLKNGRYQIKPPGKNARTGYTRATTITKTLDDQSSLISWNASRTALGLVAQPHLFAAIAACDPENKKELYELCEKAAEAGGSATRRDQGTAIHKFLERKIEDATYNPPAPYDQDVVSILTALENAGLQIADGYSEFVVVNHSLKIAGTADLAVIDAKGNWYIADLKTGSSVKYGAQAWAIQLHIYATGDAIYHHQLNESDDYETELPNFDKTRGVIIHCEPASGKTNLHWIDLETGRQGLELALAVRQHRNAKPLTAFNLAESTTNLKTAPAPVQYVDELWRTITIERIKNVLADPKAAADLRWPADIPTIKSGEPITAHQGKTISEILTIIEKLHQLPLMQTGIVAEKPEDEPEPAPAPEPELKKLVKKEWSEKHNLDKPGDPQVNEDEIAFLRVQINFLTEPQKRWAQTIIEELRQESLTVALIPPSGEPYLRRWNITATILNLAPIEDVDVAVAVVKHCTKRPFKTLAKGLGNLTLKQSQKAFELSTKIAHGTVTLYYHENGVVTFGPESAAK